MDLLHKCDRCGFKGEHQEMGFKPFGVCQKYTNLIDAQRAYESEKCPFQSGDTDSDRLPAMGEIKEKTSSEKIADGFALLSEGLLEMIKNLADEFREAFTAFTDFCVNIGDWQEFLETYPNRKVVHLAFRASKNRIRKKNMARLRDDYYRKY